MMIDQQHSHGISVTNGILHYEAGETKNRRLGDERKFMPLIINDKRLRELSLSLGDYLPSLFSALFEVLCFLSPREYGLN